MNWLELINVFIYIYAYWGSQGYYFLQQKPFGKRSKSNAVDQQ